MARKRRRATRTATKLLLNRPAEEAFHQRDDSKYGTAGMMYAEINIRKGVSVNDANSDLRSAVIMGGGNHFTALGAVQAMKEIRNRSGEYGEACCVVDDNGKIQDVYRWEAIQQHRKGDIFNNPELLWRLISGM